MMKTCNKCNKTKELVEFGKKAWSKDGLYPICKSCVSNRNKEDHAKDPRLEYKREYSKNRINSWQADPLRQRESQLRRFYDIDQLQYLAMLAHQSGECAVCGVDSADLPQRLDVDHDHETGLVRGLLCRGCNGIIERCEGRDAIAQYLHSTPAVQIIGEVYARY